MAQTAGRSYRVVIVGAGFGGLNAAKILAGAPVEVVIVDRRNHHLFQPLLYQVATASLSPADIAYPVRKIFRNAPNVQVVLGEVQSVDTANRQVHLAGQQIAYDYLILAAGATHSYFGHEEWAADAPGLKTLDDATDIRARFLLAFEEAELETDLQARKAALTFVIVGGGPTGVELAGTLAEIARQSLPRDFRSIDTSAARVVLVEGSPRVLQAFPESCSADAQMQLERLGVEVLTGTRVTHIDAGGVQAGDQRIEAGSVFWAAGVMASPIGASLGVPTDRAGRILVQGDLSIPGSAEVFVIGDQAAFTDPLTSQAVPGVAPAAIQMGCFVGKLIAGEVSARVRNRPIRPRPVFHYRDKGNLATIGRNKAVAVIRRWRTKGFIAWLLWAGVHIFFLIGFRNRLAVMFSWFWTYVLFDRGVRLITGPHRPNLKKPRHWPSETSHRKLDDTTEQRLT